MYCTARSVTERIYCLLASACGDIRGAALCLCAMVICIHGSVNTACSTGMFLGEISGARNVRDQGDAAEKVVVATRQECMRKLLWFLL